MNKPLFIWLGSGRARRRKVGAAGQWLDEAARAGLPVPSGAILLDEFFRVCLDEGLVVWSGDTIIIPDAELLHNTLFYSVRLPHFERPVTVRPVGTTSDGRAFDSADPPALTEALAENWTSIHNAAQVRYDVMMMEQVAATHSGVVTCLLAAEEDNVVLASRGTESALSLGRLQSRQAADAALPPFARRLQMLLRGLGRTLGPGDRVVHWADDGHICWLVGVSAVPQL